MSADDRLDRRIEWTSRGAVLLLVLILGIAVWTLGTVSVARGEEREAIEAQTAELAEQNSLLRDQNRTLERLMERQRRVDAASDARLAGAIDDVEALLIDNFAIHDENAAVKLNELLARIAALLGRPAGEPIEPATVHPTSDRGAPPATRPPREGAPAPTPTTAPPSTTTTTSPGRSGLCERNPTIPLCRSPR